MTVGKTFSSSYEEILRLSGLWRLTLREGVRRPSEHRAIERNHPTSTAAARLVIWRSAFFTSGTDFSVASGALALDVNQVVAAFECKSASELHAA